MWKFYKDLEVEHHLFPVGDVSQTLVESNLGFDAAADAVVRAEERVEVAVVSVQLFFSVTRLKLASSKCVVHVYMCAWDITALTYTKENC